MQNLRKGAREASPAPSFFKSRRLMCLVLCFASGIGLSRVLPFGWILLPLAAVLFVAACLIQQKTRAFWLLMGVSLLITGVYRGGSEINIPEMPALSTWTVEGTIEGRVRKSTSGIWFFVKDVAVQTPEESAAISIDSSVYVFASGAKTALSHGDRVLVEGKSYSPDVRRNPGGFDQRMWMAQQGAHVRIYASRAPQRVQSAQFSIKGLALSISESLSGRMDRLFGGASPVVRAMLLGDQTDVDADWKAWLQRAGISHILSVSGLHVALWYLILNWLLRPVPASPRVRLLLLSLLLMGYALLTGLEAPVVRSAVMLLFMHGAHVMKRKVDPLTSLAVAAGLILAFRPLDLFAPSFQLSFCAVLGLVLLRPQLKRRMHLKPEAINESILTTIAAQVGILPAQLSWFGTVSVAGFFVNLVAVPLSTLLIPVSVVALLLDAAFAPLAFLAVHAARGLVAMILWLSKAASELPFSVFRLGALSWAGTITCFVVLFLCSSAVVWKWPRRFLLMGLCVLLTIGAGVYAGDFGVRYVQLDVGQALSGVLHVGLFDVYVYDCGEAGSDLTEYLLYTGGRVKGLFLSHPHTDHTAGIDELLDNHIQIDTLYVPENADAFGAEPKYEARISRAEKAGAKVVEISAGDVLELSGLAAQVVAPDAQPLRGSDPNDRSIILRVEIGKKSLLLCGDADGAAEPLGVDIDVLQVAHHGSRVSAQEAFLTDATPDVALISVGKNSYGHPHADAVSRLEEVGADIYMTVNSGAITVYFEGDFARVEEYIDDT